MAGASGLRRFQLITLLKSALLLALVFVVFITALAIIHNKYLSRSLHRDIYLMQTERRSLNNEWGRLTLEYHTLTAEEHLRKRAINRLKMRDAQNQLPPITRPRQR